MKKYLIVLTVAIFAVSCKKESVNNVDNAEATDNTSKESKEASYAFGMSLGQRAEQFNMNPNKKDSLDTDELLSGINDYLANPDKFESYALGLNLGQNIAGAMNDNAVLKGSLNKESILNGLKDYLNKSDLEVSKDSIAPIMQNFLKHRQESIASENKTKGEKFIAEKLSEEGVQKTDSTGLAYKVIKAGEGDKPVEGDIVEVKYKGTTIAGKEFDGTDKNNDGNPRKFTLRKGGLIDGWVEAIQLMSKGAKYEFYIPSDLAYKDTGKGQDVGPGETLIFEIELVDFSKPDPNAKQKLPTPQMLPRAGK